MPQPYSPEKSAQPRTSSRHLIHRGVGSAALQQEKINIIASFLTHKAKSQTERRQSTQKGSGHLQPAPPEKGRSQEQDPKGQDFFPKRSGQRHKRQETQKLESDGEGGPRPAATSAGTSQPGCPRCPGTPEPHLVLLSHLQLGQSHTSGARATHLARPRSASAPPCHRHRFIARKSRVWRFPVSPTPGPRAGAQSAPKGKGEFSAPLPGSRGRFPTGGGRGRFPTCPSRRPSPRGTRARARGSDPSCPNRCPRRAAPACAAAGPAWLLTPPSVPVPAPAANPVTGLAAGQEGTR